MARPGNAWTPRQCLQPKPFLLHMPTLKKWVIGLFFWEIGSVEAPETGNLGTRGQIK